MKNGLFIVALATAGTSPAVGQPQRDSAVRAPQSAEVRQIAQAYGDCVVKQDHGAAQAFVLQHLRVPKDDRAGQVLIEKISYGRCLTDASRRYFSTVRMRFPADSMRYALADALFRRDLAGRPPLSDLGQVAPLEHATFNESDYQPKPGKTFNSEQLEQAQFARSRDLASITASQLGECIVRNDPAAAYALLRTSVATPAENMAFAPIAQKAGQCVQQGAAIELDKAILRGTVAFNYYRLAFAPRTQTPAMVSGK